ncbi:SIS binding protein [Perkinsus olseni]|uniref:SIS binding protein n=1 Tax=Perkinsus olseni TaxID=32597 RepID=A0A7J6P1P6_PEROL|nr:SIS binding protein [Perkinsus olseni]
MNHSRRPPAATGLSLSNPHVSAYCVERVHKLGSVPPCFNLLFVFMAKAAQKQRRDGIPETTATGGQKISKVERGRYEQGQARAPRTDANRTRNGKNPPKGESKGRKAPSLNSELVEDMTALRMGKARLVSKNKNKPSKLKEVILRDKVNDDGDDDTKGSDGRNVPEITVRHYVHQ